MTQSTSNDALVDVARRALGTKLADLLDQSLIPTLAKDAGLMKRLATAVSELPTSHRLVRADARHLDSIEDESVHLVVTSPPYWTLKRYEDSTGQLGHIEDYESFLREIDRVWAECHRVLVPGGRLVIVVGDVCLSRKTHGRHEVVPLHASIVEHCRRLGFSNLAPIIWYKIANARYEVDNGSGGFLGKPYEPNAVIKNDIEFILMQRKPGGYRSPTMGMRLLSAISEVDHREWFRQVWTLPGASTREHPAPYPLPLADRLIRMFSFVGDVVLDPFMGTATTCLAAAKCGRNSVGVEVNPSYFEIAKRNMAALESALLQNVSLSIEEMPVPSLALVASGGLR